MILGWLQLLRVTFVIQYLDFDPLVSGPLIDEGTADGNSVVGSLGEFEIEFQTEVAKFFLCKQEAPPSEGQISLPSATS